MRRTILALLVSVVLSLQPRGSLAAPPADNNIIYGTQGNAGDQLVRIDRLTGGGTLIGSTGQNFPGLAISPTGTMYAVTRSLGADLYQVDPSNGVSTLVGNLGLGDWNALAFDAGGNLFGAVLVAGSARLCSIDPGPPSVTQIGIMGGDIAGLAFDPTDGTLYASAGFGGDQIYRVNTSTAALTLVGATGLGGATPDIVFDIFGNLYGTKGGGIGNPSTLIRIDKSTGAGATIGPIGFDGVSGLASQAFVARSPKGGYYGTQGGAGDALVRIDVATGAGTLVGNSGLNLPGLAIGPTGLIYGTTQISGMLYVLDAATGARAFVGTTGVSYLDALAFDRDGVLWGLGDAGPETLYRLDPETGAAVAIGPTGFMLAGLAADPADGKLYASAGGSGGDGLYAVDKASGSTTLIGSTGVGVAVQDLLFDVFGNLYGVYGGGGNPSNLIRIDKTTGAGTVVGPVGFNGISGLASRTLVNARRGLLYATTGSTVDVLLTIDPQTGAGTLVGNTGIAGMPGLAIDSFGQIYCTSRTSGDLYRLDGETGQSFLVGSTSVAFFDAIAFNASDQLWGLGDLGLESLYRIDPMTAATVLVGATGEALGGASFDPTTNTLYASSGGVAVTPDALYRVNTANGAATLVGTTGLGGAIPDIQFDGGGQLFGVKPIAGASNLILMNKTTGAATAIGAIGFHPVSGLASIPGQRLLDAPPLASGSGRLQLLPAAPNPIGTRTLLRFSLPRESRTRLEVFNVLGQRVALLVDGVLPAGDQRVTFQPRRLPPGLYYALLTADGARDSQKILILD